jgi:hypothetical protein
MNPPTIRCGTYSAGSNSDGITTPTLFILSVGPEIQTCCNLMMPILLFLPLLTPFLPKTKRSVALPSCHPRPASSNKTSTADQRIALLILSGGPAIQTCSNLMMPILLSLPFLIPFPPKTKRSAASPSCHPCPTTTTAARLCCSRRWLVVALLSAVRFCHCTPSCDC